ncbi:MAG: uracil phosphoribosyltransferase [Paludibacteraceae bacterium]|jgi:uracil phosphoribosyltransferase|nr:uracil phosphoribosyltransferase [Paludibacteraceae bacterium]
MKVIHLSEQPSLLNQYLKEMRSVDVQKDSMRFRRNIERIGEIMAVEISKQLTYTLEQVQTPLAIAEMQVSQDQVVLGTVLRAGLPMHQGFLNMFDRAENAFVSAYRRETIGRRGETNLEIISEYLAAPSIENKTLILVDPMLATGLSMEVAYKALLSHGMPKNVHIACIFATPQSIQYLQDTMPEDAMLWCAVIDPELNEKKYIVPGLGDAGDLCFGAKL